VVMVAVTAISIALVGPSVTATNEAAAGPVTFDGGTLLRGLFFGVGAVADRHPQLALTNIDETPENLGTVADAIDKLESRSPGSLAQFRSAMYSGDSKLIAERATDAIHRLARSMGVQTDGTGAAYGDPIDELLAITNGKPHEYDSPLMRWAIAVADSLSPAA
jgi:hypothetical protein